MYYSINSRKLGEMVNFSRPGNFYVYVDLNGKPGTLGNQICDGGKMMGSTIGYRGDDDAVFATLCKKWWKSYLRNEREY